MTLLDFSLLRVTFIPFVTESVKLCYSDNIQFSWK